MKHGHYEFEPWTANRLQRLVYDLQEVAGLFAADGDCAKTISRAAEIVQGHVWTAGKDTARAERERRIERVRARRRFKEGF